MQKRGQVTIFLILGLLIIIVIAVILALRYFSVSEGEKEVEKAEAAPMLGYSIKDYVDSCIKKTGEEAITYVSEHGGYYELPELSHPGGWPYYIYEDSIYMISQEELEEQLSKYMDAELFFCIKNFVGFKEYGLQIKQEEVSAVTGLFNDQVLFDVTFPITVMQDTLQKHIAYFSIAIPSSLGQLRSVSSEYLQRQKKDLGGACVSCIVNLMIENNFRVEMDDFGNNSVRFTIINEKGDLPAKYVFMSKFKTQDIVKENSTEEK